jgi:hypothetical protein
MCSLVEVSLSPLAKMASLAKMTSLSEEKAEKRQEMLGHKDEVQHAFFLVPGLLDRKGGRRCHLLLNKREHPLFLSNDPGIDLYQPVTKSSQYYFSFFFKEL